jgi:hypothetical protein
MGKYIKNAGAFNLSTNVLQMYNLLATITMAPSLLASSSEPLYCLLNLFKIV